MAISKQQQINERLGFINILITDISAGITSNSSSVGNKVSGCIISSHLLSAFYDS